MDNPDRMGERGREAHLSFTRLWILFHARVKFVTSPSAHPLVIGVLVGENLDFW